MRRGILALALAPLAAFGPAASGQSPEPPKAPTLRAAAVQLRSTRDLDRNVGEIARAIGRLGREGVRVVVFPECALTGYFEDAIRSVSAETLAEAERRIGDACREAGVYAVVGTPRREGDALYNSATVFDPSGRVLTRYDKVQLAEAWPTAGERMVVFPVDGVLCSALVCHDERYPELVRLPVLAGARVIFYLSHESGLRLERKVGPYRAQIQARAVENGIFVVQANAPANQDTTGSHGQSRIIAPDGNIIHEATIFGEDTVVANMDLKQADAGNALRSMTRGPLRDWWEAGRSRVVVLGPDGEAR